VNLPGGPNFISLQSDAGDYIGAGKTYLYSQASAVLAVSASGGHLSVRVTGDQSWFADFAVPNTLAQLQAGTYANLTRYPFDNAAVGGLSWSGEGRGCNTLTGQFTIDSVAYAAGTLTSIDLRFEQHCEGAVAALRGTIHWAAGDPTAPPGPTNPIPADLWQPAAGSTPSTGNYTYLVSDAGDFIGQGQTNTYTAANAPIFNVQANGNYVFVGVGGWDGDFKAMNSISNIQVGYYPGLIRYPFNNPVKGGLNWNGQGRGCNTLTGWFVVDSVTYVSGTLTAIDLRFEQHCEGGTPALHGAVHWAQ